MKFYDPEVTPDPAEWLALDEQERIQLVEAQHRAARTKLPNAKAHAAFHVIVENQIAEGLEPVVRAMARLANDGLSRHDALHAIASVVAEQFFDAAKAKEHGSSNTAQARYNAAVERVDAKEWCQRYDV